MTRRWPLVETAADTPGRVIAGLASAVPLLAFWELVVRPWPAAFSPVGLPLLVIGLGGLGIGVTLLAGAILATDHAVIVDEDQRVLLMIGRLPWIGPVHRRIAFSRIAAVEIARDSDSDSLRPLSLRLRLDDGRWSAPLLTRPLTDHDELAGLATRLRAAIFGPQG